MLASKQACSTTVLTACIQADRPARFPAVRGSLLACWQDIRLSSKPYGQPSCMTAALSACFHVCRLTRCHVAQTAGLPSCLQAGLPLCRLDGLRSCLHAVVLSCRPDRLLAFRHVVVPACFLTGRRHADMVSRFQATGLTVFHAFMPTRQPAANIACQLVGTWYMVRNMIIVVANSKGGVGKSTLAVHLAAWLHEQGHTVTLADCDTQHSSSQWIREAVPDVKTVRLATADEILEELPQLRQGSRLRRRRRPGKQYRTSAAACCSAPTWRWCLARPACWKCARSTRPPRRCATPSTFAKVNHGRSSCSAWSARTTG